MIIGGTADESVPASAAPPVPLRSDCGTAASPARSAGVSPHPGPSQGRVGKGVTSELTRVSDADSCAVAVPACLSVCSGIRSSPHPARATAASLVHVKIATAMAMLTPRIRWQAATGCGFDNKRNQKSRGMREASSAFRMTV